MNPPAAFAVDQAVAAHAAVAAAAEIGLLGRLERRAPATPEALAAELALDPNLVSRLLDALMALGIVEPAPGRRVGVDGPVRTVLAASRDQYARLPRLLRGGDRAHSVDEPDGAARTYGRLAGVLGEAFAPAADEFAEVLAAPGLRVLDAGAGAAPWSLALVRAAPDAEVVALDLPGVIEPLRAAVVDAGAAASFRLVAGDLTDGALGQDLGGPFDLVIAANLLHLFDAERATRLVGALAAELADGGRLAVVDVLPDRVREDPRVALYALGLALRTASGGLHARDDHRRWMARAGLRLREVHRSSRLPGLALLVGA